MRYLCQLRAIGAVAAVAALVVPAAASAHPSVYTGTATIVANPGPPPVFEPQARHMVTNHGFTIVLRETNGVGAPGGILSYALLPSALRAQLDPDAQLVTGGTAAQPHATCSGVSALADPDNIRAWQGTDPFYNYIPFQKAAAGLDDHPADWIDDVLTLTNGAVDLTQVSDDPAQAVTELTAECAALGGSFKPADQTQTPASSLASGTVELATEPLLEEIDQLETFTAQLQAQKAAAEQAAASAQAGAGQAVSLQQENQALRAEVARMTLEATTLRIRPVGNRSPGQLAANGISVRVTGPAGKRVTVRLLVSGAVAKALGLKSRVLGKATTTIGADATALVKITLGRRAKAAMRRAKRSMSVAFEAVSGDRSASATRRLSR